MPPMEQLALAAANRCRSPWRGRATSCRRLCQVMSPHHLVFSVSAVKSRITRPGADGAVLSTIVVRFFFHRCRPTMRSVRIRRVTHFRLIPCPRARSSTWTHGAP